MLDANDAKQIAIRHYSCAIIFALIVVFGASPASLTACLIADVCTSEPPGGDDLIPPLCFFLGGWTSERKWRAWL